MAYKIIETILFTEQVIELNTWLEENWSMQVAVNFHALLIKTILLIAQKPGIGRVAAFNKNIRSKLITHHNRLYYRVDDYAHTITLLTLFDTRQDPQKNKYD